MRQRDIERQKKRKSETNRNRQIFFQKQERLVGLKVTQQITAVYFVTMADFGKRITLVSTATNGQEVPRKNTIDTQELLNCVSKQEYELKAKKYGIHYSVLTKLQ